VALRPAELVRLEREHGSLEAAAEALPEHRDELERAAANVRLIAANVAAAVPRLELGARPAEPPARVARQAVLDLAAGGPLEPLEVRFERALERALRPGAREPGRPGPEPDPIPRATLEKAVRLLVNGESKRGVAAKTDLSRWKVDRIAELVDAGELTWTAADRLGLPAGTPATRAGVILPRR
jgi:hypothetical protein